jgi:hypothetical protein
MKVGTESCHPTNLKEACQIPSLFGTSLIIQGIEHHKELGTGWL